MPAVPPPLHNVIRFDRHRRDDKCLHGEPSELDPLTFPHIAALVEAAKEVIADGGWGEVTLVFERGRVHAVRRSTSQLFLDQLLLANETSKRQGAI